MDPLTAEEDAICKKKRYNGKGQVVLRAFRQDKSRVPPRNAVNCLNGRNPSKAGAKLGPGRLKILPSSSWTMAKCGSLHKIVEVDDK